MDDLRSKDKQHIWHPFTPLTGGIEPVEFIYIRLTEKKSSMLFHHGG
jgi:hypothetical protein